MWAKRNAQTRSYSTATKARTPAYIARNLVCNLLSTEPIASWTYVMSTQFLMTCTRPKTALNFFFSVTWKWHTKHQSLKSWRREKSFKSVQSKTDTQASWCIISCPDIIVSPKNIDRVHARRIATHRPLRWQRRLASHTQGHRCRRRRAHKQRCRSLGEREVSSRGRISPPSQR